jgi:hypothetical protein
MSLFPKEFQDFCKDVKCVAYMKNGCYNIHSEMCCHTVYEFFEWKHEKEATKQDKHCSNEFGECILKNFGECKDCSYFKS